MAYTSFVDVLLLLIRDDRVLLAERAGTGFADGQWNLPSGKLEDGEDLVAALIREAREEIAVELSRDDVEMVTAVHNRNRTGTHGLVSSSVRVAGMASRATPSRTSARGSAGSHSTSCPPTRCRTPVPGWSCSAAASRSG